MQINRIFKYLVCALVIHTAIAYLPREIIPFEESIIIIILCIAMLFVLDCISDNKTEQFNNIIENLDVDRSIDEKVTILTELEEKGTLDKKSINTLKNVCSNDEEKCTNYLNNMKITDNEKLELQMVFGYSKFLPITNLFYQGRLDRKQAMDIVYAISTESSTILDVLLSKNLKDKLISEDDKEKIIALSNLDEDYNQGRLILSNMIFDDKISLEKSKEINQKCTSSSLSECSTYLRNQIDKGVLNEVNAVSILRGYNRPNINVDGKFGELSYNKSYDNQDFIDKDNVDILKDQLPKLKNDRKIFDSEFKDEEYDEFNDFDLGTDNYVDIQIPGKQKIKHKYSQYYDENSDMKFNKIKPLVPLGKYSKSFTNKFDHGFDYLKTHKWRPPEYDIKQCKIDKCDTCEEHNNYPIELSNFNNSRKLLEPDNIEVNYLEDKLNTGRN